jgi:hypothetical protein
MAVSLVLDAGALIAFERNVRDTVALINSAQRNEHTIVVPAGVVGQVWRDGSRQARLARLLHTRAVTVEPLTDTTARAAGVLCGSTSTTDVVDASVVITARLHRAPVLSSGRGDLHQLDSNVPVIDC